MEPLSEKARNKGASRGAIKRAVLIAADDNNIDSSGSEKDTSSLHIAGYSFEVKYINIDAQNVKV